MWVLLLILSGQPVVIDGFHSEAACQRVGWQIERGVVAGSRGLPNVSHSCFDKADEAKAAK
jgi:hypothetical protein